MTQQNLMKANPFITSIGLASPVVAAVLIALKGFGVEITWMTVLGVLAIPSVLTGIVLVVFLVLATIIGVVTAIAAVKNN